MEELLIKLNRATLNPRCRASRAKRGPHVRNNPPSA